MQTSQRHIIHRQIIELSLPKEEGAFAIQSKASRLFQQQVAPALEQLLTALTPEGEYLSIERLEVDLGRIPLEGWEGRFAQQSLEALTEALSAQGVNIRKGDTEALQTFEAMRLRQLLDFLKTGWVERGPELPKDPSALEATFLDALQREGRDWRRQFRQLFGQAPASLRRLLGQFSTDFVIVFCSVVCEFDFQPWSNRFQQLGAAKQERLLQEVLPPLSVGPNDGSGALENLFDRVEAGEAAMTYEAPTFQAREKTGEEGIFIENSGLVLLYPFLERFFEACTLTKNGAFCSHEEQLNAVQLLQYLCTGEEQHFEFSLPLNKLLCNVPLDEPLRRDLPLQDAWKNEAERMLQASITHWPALKNTSVAGLRETFLLRSGKLAPLSGSSDWRLQVETKGADILLNRLPWGFSLIRLPWMPGFLHTEWIY